MRGLRLYIRRAMPNPSTAPDTAARPASQRNVFLDDTRDAITLDGPQNDADPTRAVGAAASGQFDASANLFHDTGRQGRSQRHRGHRASPRSRKLIAAAAIAATAATVLALSPGLAEERQPGSGEAARPGVAAPATSERPDSWQRPDAGRMSSPRHHRILRPRARFKHQTPGAGKHGARRGTQPPAPADPGMRSSQPAPKPSATPTAAPAPRSGAPGAGALPAPVPSDAPPEFM